ncbi:craniofacial development protein 2-like [Nilaparvata lugens]|nr:craniofacial development protein 2-like [Nilaparvata lugens]
MVEEMKKYKIKVLGICETRRRGVGERVLEEGYVMRYSGVADGRRACGGVAIVIDEETNTRVRSWKAISPRIIRVDLDLEEKISIIQVYGPTEDANVAEKDEFWMQLERETIEAEESRKLVVIGDFNGRIGMDEQVGNGCMGKYGCEVIKNNNGQRLIEYASQHNFLIGNTWFIHKRIHKITFVGEGREAESMIDYILYQGELRYAFRDVKVIRGAELDTDHKLLVADTGFRERKVCRQKAYRRIKHEELRLAENREKYKVELSNRIENLQNAEDMQNNVDFIWSELKEVIMGAAEEVCGQKVVGRFKRRTRWWSEEVKMKVREKKKAYKKFIGSKRQEDYRIYVEKRNVAKRTVKLAKIESWENFGRDLQNLHGRENGRAFWRTVKQLRGKFGKQTRSIVDENGRLVSQLEEVMERWRRYYENKFQRNENETGFDQDEHQQMMDE